ncbi:Protocadherin Fat 3 [Frankliniella fusca]|uniref:Protocadherin Fat 3 n=1 Tax=Frankliniella fusca TaxID=407009 RepID=A0AAE1HF47_9NEOP|nr:Protocadherin Fat 3 [Frankliniella fusca]
MFKCCISKVRSYFILNQIDRKLRHNVSTGNQLLKFVKDLLYFLTRCAKLSEAEYSVYRTLSQEVQSILLENTHWKPKRALRPPSARTVQLHAQLPAQRPARPDNLKHRPRRQPPDSPPLCRCPISPKLQRHPQLQPPPPHPAPPRSAPGPAARSATTRTRMRSPRPAGPAESLVRPSTRWKQLHSRTRRPGTEKKETKKKEEKKKEEKKKEEKKKEEKKSHTIRVSNRRW